MFIVVNVRVDFYNGKPFPLGIPSIFCLFLRSAAVAIPFLAWILIPYKIWPFFIPAKQQVLHVASRPHLLLSKYHFFFYTLDHQDQRCYRTFHPRHKSCSRIPDTAADTTQPTTNHYTSLCTTSTQVAPFSCLPAPCGKELQRGEGVPLP